MNCLSGDKINIVNQIAETICAQTCSSGNCSLCQLNQLRFGIDSVFGQKMSVEAAIERMIENYRITISNANSKYDALYSIH